jgi:putative transposase
MPDQIRENLMCLQYEVPYEWGGQRVVLVVDPHENQALRIESSKGQPLGTVTRLDRQANAHRRRHKGASTTPARSTLISTR